MHIAGQSFGKAMANPRGTAWRSQTALQVHPFLSVNDASLLDSEVAFHEQHSLQELPQGVVHGDLFRDNVLFDGARIGGVIDFYFACNDSMLYDVAITANDWCLNDDETLNPERTRALLAAYHTERPFTDEEKALWPVALRLAALRFWISRLYDLHLPRDGEMIHAHDPDQFRRILQRHLASGGDAPWI